jgi:hypothetical protein
MLGRLKAKIVTKVRVCPEDLALKRGASSKIRVLIIDAVRLAPPL